MQMYRDQYRKLFSIEEIENSETLQKFLYVITIGFFLGLQQLFFRDIGMIGTTNTVCPEYFQNCTQYSFLPSIFESSLFNLFYTLQSTLVFAACLFAYKKDWTLAHLCLLIPFFIKLIFNVFFTTNISVPFETDHLLPCAFFLFGHSKRRNIQIAVIFLYVLSGFVKLDSGWILGTYFSTLKMGLPFVPDSLLILACNLVILLELVGIWLLFTSYKKPVLWILIFFHIYSSIFVTFNYPIQILPILLVAFAIEDTPKALPSFFGAIVIALVTLLNLAPYLISGDHKMTYEGQALALNMFDANRQTHSEEKIIYKNGQEKNSNTSAENAVERVTPYSIFYKLKAQCKDPNVERVEWKMVESLNGAPFYLLVQENDVCKLQYKAYAHNEWIRLDKTIMGYPMKNYYYGPNGLRAIPQIKDQEVFPNQNKDVTIFAIFYLVLAIATPIVVFRKKTT